MNEWLAQYFGTAPVSDDMAKQADAELFVKLAQENGIDLNAMSEAEVAELYESTMGKTAEETKVAEFPPKKDDGDEDKKKKEEAAAKEHEEKKESAAKFAEAVLMGQIMAHSMESERDKIAAAKEAGAKELAGKAGDAAKLFGRRVTGASLGLKGGKATPAIDAARAAHEHAGAPETATRLMREHAAEKGNIAKARKQLAAGAGIAAAAGGGVAAATHKKEASALDELAAEHAVTKVAEAGWDADEAAQRLASILVLGVSDENSKVATVATLPEAVEIRALELAEAAGYPINWPQE